MSTHSEQEKDTNATPIRELGIQAIMSAIQMAVARAVEPLTCQIEKLLPLKQQIIELNIQVSKLTGQLLLQSKATNQSFNLSTEASNNTAGEYEVREGLSSLSQA